MTNVSEVADGIYQIDINGVNPPVLLGPPICSMIYFITNNGQTALIETGPAKVAPIVLDVICQLGHDPSRLSYIILTHIHLDHAGGVGTLAQQLPQLQVLVHPRGAKHLIDPSKLIEGTRQAYDTGFEDVYGPILPIPERQIHAVKDEEFISLGDKELRIIYAPGHASHQMCIYEAKNQGVFSGDVLGSPKNAIGMVKWVGGFDFDAALNTIDKLRKLNPKIVFCSHGGVNRDASKLIQSVWSNTKAYGDIILKAIRAGENNEKITQRLEAYQIKYAPSEYRPGEHQFDSIITQYTDYFKRKAVT
ncbi:MBL fold metallo-hydrolase [Chloroflexota bacterium]